jgi:hypothetical protein
MLLESDPGARNGGSPSGLSLIAASRGRPSRWEAPMTKRTVVLTSAGNGRAPAHSSGPPTSRCKHHHTSAGHLAREANAIGYEILTNLGGPC